MKKTKPLDRRTFVDSLFSSIGLQGRAIGAILFASLLPLALCCGGFWEVATRAQRQSALDAQRRVVEIQASSIEADLERKLGDLELVAHSVSLDVQGGGVPLESLLLFLNQGHDDAFIDLGVIGWDGALLAHTGPADFTIRSYAEEEWFQQTRERGSCICRLPPGPGGESRLVLAVKRRTGSFWWVLASTASGNQIDAIVDAGRWGSTGEARLVDAGCGDGDWPVAGVPWDRGAGPPLATHAGIDGSPVLLAGRSVIRTTTRLNDDRWILAVQQDESEILSPLYRILSVGALLLLVCVFFLVNTTIVTVRFLVRGGDRSPTGRGSIPGDLVSRLRFGRRARELQ